MSWELFWQIMILIPWVAIWISMMFAKVPVMGQR